MKLSDPFSLNNLTINVVKYLACASWCVFLGKKKKLLLISSRKNAIFSNINNEALHFFWRHNEARLPINPANVISSEKSKCHIISSETKRCLIISLEKIKCLIISLEKKRTFFEEIMRHFIFLWKDNQAHWLVNLIILPMLILQKKKQVPHYFFR